MDDPSTTEMMDKKKSLYNTINDNIKSDFNSMHTALSKVGVILEDESLENIFYDKGMTNYLED